MDKQYDNVQFPVHKEKGHMGQRAAWRLMSHTRIIKASTSLGTNLHVLVFLSISPYISPYIHYLPVSFLSPFSLFLSSITLYCVSAGGSEENISSTLLHASQIIGVVGIELRYITKRKVMGLLSEQYYLCLSLKFNKILRATNTSLLK